MTSGIAEIPDARVRWEVLEPGISFLVQAPAGSGKTELLIQRYLKLLTVVDDPEEILAITFTRKAAAEMRSRVLDALSRARANQRPDADHLQVGFDLALQVIERERRHDWQLEIQPNRLRISTIDSVNTRLARKAPLSTGPTSSNDMVEDAERLYRVAARDTIYHAEEPDHYGAAVTELLRHCDNRVDRLETLLKNMLARRDQWMPMLASGQDGTHPNLRSYLEGALGALIEHALAATDNLLVTHRQDLVEVLNYAGASITIENPDADLARWQEVAEFPTARVHALTLWRSMADVFLTKQGRWRKALNKNQGFPPDGPVMKARARELLQTLSEIDNAETALREVQHLPDPIYSDPQWSALEALLHVLPLAAANLKQVFAAQGKTDFCEIAQEAFASIGAEDETTALSLSLDYQISHILLDEFQDTSRSQFELLKKLTAGWQEGGDRTLFLVGDPMQSIYRFREAQVGLFLEAKKHGIGDIDLCFRSLTTNFRSDPEIVGWFNEVFAEVMPREKDEDPVSGAISFSPSTAFKPAGPGSCINWNVTGFGDREAEAEEVLRIVRDTRSLHADESIAILVRSRQHGADIAKRLKQECLKFASADLESIEAHEVIQDLLALTRALAHRGDRLAWLAVLRGPWCGLTLEDLTALSTADSKSMIWDLIETGASSQGLSADARARLARVRSPLERGLRRKGSMPLRDCVESVWLELGGPATVSDPSDLRLADDFFDFLDSVDAGGDCPDNAELLSQLRDWRVEGTLADEKLQIMTMHKAKGLEFDTVILPGLGYPTRKDERRLLVWHEMTETDGDRPLVLAPLHAAGDEPDEIYEFLWRFDQYQASLEQDRLLYVAVTRARKRLHLMAPLSRDDDGIAEPVSGSLLKRLWPAVRDRVRVPAGMTLPARGEILAKEPDWFDVEINRIRADWERPSAPPAWRPILAGLESSDQPDIEFEWVSGWAVHAGSVVHEWLQIIAEGGPEEFDSDRLTAMRPAFERRLRELGIADEEISVAADRVVHALVNTVVDEKGRWILFGRHSDAQSEFSLTVPKNEGFERLILDRTFVCEKGDRWIIDYKNSTHEGGQLDGFLRSETERYKPQLTAYRDAMAQTENRRIRTALYFPLLRKFHEVDVDR